MNSAYYDSKYSGCLQLVEIILEVSRSLKLLLEIARNLVDSLGKFYN